MTNAFPLSKAQAAAGHRCAGGHRITVTVLVPVGSTGRLAVAETSICLLTPWRAIVTWLLVPASPKRASSSAPNASKLTPRLPETFDPQSATDTVLYDVRFG